MIQNKEKCYKTICPKNLRWKTLVLWNTFGIEVSRSKSWIFLSQRMYTIDLLKLACLLKIDPNHVSVDKGWYQRLVERLMHLAHTKPNLHYTLSVVSQYMHDPCEQHMKVVMRILRIWRGVHENNFLFIYKKWSSQSLRVYQCKLGRIIWSDALRRVTSLLWDTILLHEGVRSRMWLLVWVQKMNIKAWH